MSAYRLMLIGATIAAAVSACAQPALHDSFEAPALDARWTVDSSAEASATVDAERQVLVLQTLDNRYNHVETPLPADFGRVQADLLNINDTAASWSPGVILYWDETNWVQVMLSLTYSLRVNWADGGEGGATGNLRPIIAGTWYRVALEMRPDEIGVLFGEPGGEPAQVATVPRVPAWESAPTLIIGKGYMPIGGGNPDFDNNYSRSTRMTRVEVDDVIVGDPAPLARQLGVESGRGALVAQVAPGSPAEKAGLRPGDVILDVNRKPVSGPGEVAEAIEVMVIRGAPAIGIAAAMGMALAAKQAEDKSAAAFQSHMREAHDRLYATRPTAVNLRWALERVQRLMNSMNGASPREIAAALVEEGKKVLAEDIEINRKMGFNGAEYLEDGDVVLTHCNAGALATGGYGTALGVIRAAIEQGKRIEVVADETRPFLQGARLTVWAVSYTHLTLPTKRIV